MLFEVKTAVVILLLVLSCNGLPNKHLKFRPILSSSSEKMQSNLSGNRPKNVETTNGNKDNPRREILYAMPGGDYKMFMPKSLQITYEPTQNESKLKISDTLLETILKHTVGNFSNKSPTTKKPKKQKPINKLPPPRQPLRPEPRPLKKQSGNKSKAEEELHEESVTSSTGTPITVTASPRIQSNTLSGLSQIGNRESQMVIKPTVIVNIRGTVSNTDSDIKVESRKFSKAFGKSNTADGPSATGNIFNITQEIHLLPDTPSPNNTSITTDRTVNPKALALQKTEDMINYYESVDKYQKVSLMDFFDAGIFRK